MPCLIQSPTWDWQRKCLSRFLEHQKIIQNLNLSLTMCSHSTIWMGIFTSAATRFWIRKNQCSQKKTMWKSSCLLRSDQEWHCSQSSCFKRVWVVKHYGKTLNLLPQTNSEARLWFPTWKNAMRSCSTRKKKSSCSKKGKMKTRTSRMLSSD